MKSLALAIGLFTFLALPAAGKNYVVNTANDYPHHNTLGTIDCFVFPVSDPALAVCSLRAAIQIANVNPGPDTITIPTLPGDLLLSVSSSGNSENIVRGLQAAVNKGCQVITLTGFSPDNSSRKLGDLNFYVSSDAYGHVETAHAGLTHFMTDRARDLSKSTAAADSAH